MKTVRVHYRQVEDTWVATSDDVPEYRAVAATLRDLRDLVFEGLPFFLLEETPDALDIREDLLQVHREAVAVVEVPAWAVGGGRISVSSSAPTDYPIPSVSETQTLTRVFTPQRTEPASA